MSLVRAGRFAGLPGPGPELKLVTVPRALVRHVCAHGAATFPYGHERGASFITRPLPLNRRGFNSCRRTFEGPHMDAQPIRLARLDPATRRATTRALLAACFTVNGVQQRSRIARTARSGPAIGRSDRRVAAAQVRGILTECVEVSTPLDPFLSLKALASYAGISVRKLHQHLEDPAHPLPCYRVGGKLLVRRSEFDMWIASFRRRGRLDVEQIVEDVLRDVTTSAQPAPRRRP